jgi:hypothetical protein
MERLCGETIPAFEALRKTMKHHSLQRRFPGRELNRVTSEYEPGAVCMLRRYNMYTFCISCNL